MVEVDERRQVACYQLATVLGRRISVVSINYRYVSQAVADGVSPPVKAPLHDAARALQFVRSKSAEWNIDKTRIGASGAQPVHAQVSGSLSTMT